MAVEFGCARRQRHERHIAWDLENLAAMPAMPQEKSPGQTRSGAPTSPISRLAAASSTWWRSWIGRAGQPLDLVLAVGHTVAAAVLKRPRCLILQLFLSGTNLVRMNLIALRQIGDRRLLPQRLQRNLRLQRRVDLPSRSIATERT